MQCARSPLQLKYSIKYCLLSLNYGVRGEDYVEKQQDSSKIERELFLL